MLPVEIAGQLNPEERRIITAAISDAPRKPRVVLEVGTWLGGGSTLHLLRALERNGAGHLWGIEADRSIYDQMLANIRRAAPEAIHRFTPLFGFSHEVIPSWLEGLGAEKTVDVVFLDGGNNPSEQMIEFRLVDPYMPVGGILITHDAKLRKGKWLVPYVSRLDNWESKLHDVSDEGLFFAQKIAPSPSSTNLRSARWHLAQMRCAPAELAAALLPAKACDLALRLLPEKLRKGVAEGR